ncbi:MAG: penicillin-binding transpeptidase domain-containing protein [Pyrinomonadaceae bacterium]
MIYLFLLQFDWQKLKPENLFGSQVLERAPAGLSIVYLIGTAVLVVLLMLSFVRTLRPHFAFEENLPKEVKRKTGRAIANRSLCVWQIVFILLAFFVYGFHVYWTLYADENNEQFQALSYKDLRKRRTNAAALRGWMLDRTGKLTNALAYYRRAPDGSIVRTYALEKEMAHLLGTERGTPGLERTLYKQQADPMPSAWEILTRIKRPEEEQKDVRITIDRDLQAFVAQQLDGKKGAIVVLNPQTGDVLAIYSNPSFNLSDAQTLDGYLKLEGDTMNKPLLSRALREYYTPGSTFKTFTLMSAFRAGKDNARFSSFPGGFIPSKGSRPIVDATQRYENGVVTGACDGGCDEKGLTDAYKVSSNQFFAQLAIDLGRDRLRETANAVGIAPVETPAEAVTQGFFPDIWNTSNRRIANALAPERSTIVTGKGISLYDLGLEGMGQGYAGQMTPFQMALIAATPANLQGFLMKPKIEADLAPQPFAQVLSAPQASAIRDIMSTVTEEPGGTATAVFARMAGTGIRVGGKTGTAQKEAVLYDEKTGKMKTYTRKVKDENGNLVDREFPQMYERTDSWFICIAPLENPQLAISVVVEGGGYGAKVAAPIAVNVIMKARELGLLGEQYKPKTPTPKTQTVAPKRRR